MQSCNLTVTISALACELAKGKTAEEALWVKKTSFPIVNRPHYANPILTNHFMLLPTSKNKWKEDVLRHLLLWYVYVSFL